MACVGGVAVPTATVFASSTISRTSVITSTIVQTALVPTAIPVTLVSIVDGLLSNVVSLRTATSRRVGWQLLPDAHSSLVTSTTLITSVSTTVIPGAASTLFSTSCPVPTTPTSTLPSTSFSITPVTPSAITTTSTSTSNGVVVIVTPTVTVAPSSSTGIGGSALPANSGSSGSSTNVGAIVGGVVGGVAALVALIIIVFCCFRREKRPDEHKDLFEGAAAPEHGVYTPNEFKPSYIAPVPAAAAARRPSYASYASRRASQRSAQTGAEGVANWAYNSGSRRQSQRSMRVPDEAPQLPPVSEAYDAASITTAGIAGIGASSFARRDPVATPAAQPSPPRRVPSARYSQPQGSSADAYAQPVANSQQQPLNSNGARQRANMAAGLPAVSEAGSVFRGAAPMQQVAPTAASQYAQRWQQRQGPPSYTTEARQ